MSIGPTVLYRVYVTTWRRIQMGDAAIMTEDKNEIEQPTEAVVAEVEEGVTPQDADTDQDEYEITVEIGRAHVWTPVTSRTRMPSCAWKKKMEADDEIGCQVKARNEMI